MRYRIVTLRRALGDQDEIVRWLSERSVPGAIAWTEAYRALLDRLVHDPEAYGLAPEDAFVDCELRQAFFRTRRGRSYRVLFTIVDDEVRILRVRAPGLDLATDDELETADE